MARGGFPGMGGNMQQLMKQAQKMQQDVQRLQQEISEREFAAAAGGGVVKATVLGSLSLIHICSGSARLIRSRCCWPAASTPKNPWYLFNPM